MCSSIWEFLPAPTLFSQLSTEVNFSDLLFRSPQVCAADVNHRRAPATHTLCALRTEKRKKKVRTEAEVELDMGKKKESTITEARNAAYLQVSLNV